MYTVGAKEEKVSKLSKEEKKEGFKFLFDGSSLDAWTGDSATYVLENGCIVMHPEAKTSGNLYSKEEFDDFVLRFDFMLTPGANNGLGIRHKEIVAEGASGIELQILDNEAPRYKDLKPYQYHGSVYGYIPAKRGYLKPAGEWNTQEVVANGNRITVKLNGVVIVDGDLKEATKDIPADKISKALFVKKGHIAFLGHSSVVSFKNIRIKTLK
jgi:hypothetical protein